MIYFLIMADNRRYNGGRIGKAGRKPKAEGQVLI